MSQIHIFFGAPILPTSLKTSKEDKFSTATAETWKQLRVNTSFTKDTFNLCTKKCGYSEHAEHLALNDSVLDVHSKAHFEKGCGLDDRFLTEHAADAESVKSSSKKTEGLGNLTGNNCDICGDTSTDDHVKHHVYQQLPNYVETDEKQSKHPEIDEVGASCGVGNHLDVFSLVSSNENTKNISRGVTFLGQNDDPSDFQCNPHKLLSQHLEIHCPQIIKESKTENSLDVCSSLAVSADTEFLSILTSSQVVLLAGRHAVDQSEIQSNSVKVKGTKLDESHRELVDPLIKLNENGGMCPNVTESLACNFYESSLELFDSDSAMKDNCLTSLKKETSFQENAGIPTSLLHAPGDKLNKLYIEPWKKGILCSQEDNSLKRLQISEDTIPEANYAFADQQLSKKAKLICSPDCPVPRMEQLRISLFKKAQKHPSLLKDCCCKAQKYNVLVAVLHPCHIKEIQIKSGTKTSSKVPLGTIVVFDQSEIQRKIVLWRKTAFWSLTVFPGDIVLFTDVTIYENHWIGEIMLQSTFSSQLLNLGSCSTINQNEFSHIVDVNVLEDLVAYVSSEHAYLQTLPKRQPQTLNNIQHVLLDQLKPNILVHAIVKIVNITVLTECTYSYRGERQRKIILIVEQVKDQHCALVLWGSVAAYYLQLQRKRDHIWDFKYLFTKHSPVSGELELHTTPWSSFECLFDDDRRAVEFKEKFEKDVKSLMRVSSLTAHLEEKCSGTIQVKACISELKFAVASSPCGQLIFDAKTSLQHIFASLSLITYTGCAKCGLERQTDDNKIYNQCFSCLPSNKVKIFYRPALMTIEEDGYEISVRVASKLMEKIFLNIPAEWLNKAIDTSLDTKYGMIVADLCHSLLTDTQASYCLEIRSHFVLDENSYPLEKDFHLLGFHIDL
ncbi:shieldin complex subunit 2 [Hemicordylus capensis]|uniref:shieldin complex subunit 2 n=1 Tax=Hemicordylus capensis TaxID=884348 RepID=UPI002302CF1F|nr:shieldin complex subunit 2 [Hemicordylus capensis]